MNRLQRLGRLWRTVRHLKPVQIVGRAHFLWHRPRLDMRPAPPLRMACGPWVRPAAREASLTAPMRLRFLSEEKSLDNCGWDRPEVERLWRYNLHYFDDLNADGAGNRRGWQRALVARWLAENPPPLGTAWEPYPVSLRIVNWVKWFLQGEAPQADWLHSLAVQARWLRQRMEWHLLGNHLFANAKALVFAGLWFDGPEAQGWLQAGLDVLLRELPEQVLTDGGHFERSTMYHALALEDVLDLLNLLAARGASWPQAAALGAALRHHAGPMLHWLRCMAHPDGGIALFNDAAHGIAPPNADLARYAAALGIAATQPPAEGLTDLPHSGYLRAARGPAVALLDMAPIGPDYLVGHAHADTLAFELSLHGQRIVVNGGTSCYGLGAQRLHERGTAWHSTVQLGNGDSSEVWSGFRVGRRARITARDVDGWTATAAHDGWRTLPGSPQHRRRWTLKADALLVDDELLSASPGQPEAVARFHLAPGLTLQPVDNNRWLVRQANRTLAEVQVDAGLGCSEPSTHAPRFGVLQPALCLAVQLQGGRARTRWQWTTGQSTSDAHPVPH